VGGWFLVCIKMPPLLGLVVFVCKHAYIKGVGISVFSGKITKSRSKTIFSFPDRFRFFRQKKTFRKVERRKKQEFF